MKRKQYLPTEFVNRWSLARNANRAYKTGAEDGMTEEEKKREEAFLKKVSDQTAAQLKAFKDSVVEVKSFTAFEDRFKAIEEKSKNAKTELEFKSLVEDLGKLTLEVKSLKEVSVGEDRAVKKGTIIELLHKNKAKIESFVSNKSGVIQLEYKTGGAVENSTDITNRDAYFQWHEGGAIGLLPVRKPFIKNRIKNAGAENEYIKYNDQATVVRNAQGVAMCGPMTSTTKLTWAVNSIYMNKIKDMVDVCLDMMNDYAFVDSQIKDLLNSSLQLKIDNDLLLGTGSSTSLHSIDEAASTFSAAGSDAETNYAGLVPMANIVDLISVAGSQIRSFGKWNMYNPDTVAINPKDHQMIKFLKNTLGSYLKTPSLVTSLFQDNAGNLYVDGMLLIPNPLVPANELYVFDSQKATKYTRPGVGIEFAYENKDNFENDLVTLKVYERTNLLIRNVDANAFMHIDDIQAGIAAINQSGVTPE